MMRKFSNLPEWLFLGIALWHAAIVVTSITALALAAPEWRGDIAWFAVREAGKAVMFGFVWSLIRENRQLRAGTTGLAASKAFIDGFQRGTESAVAARGGVRETEEIEHG